MQILLNPPALGQTLDSLIQVMQIGLSLPANWLATTLISNWVAGWSVLPLMRVFPYVG